MRNVMIHESFVMIDQCNTRNNQMRVLTDIHAHCISYGYSQVSVHTQTGLIPSGFIYEIKMCMPLLNLSTTQEVS